MPGAAPDDAALVGRSANGLVERNSGGSPAFYDFHPEGNVSQRLSSTGAVQSTDSYGPFACPAIGLGVAGYEAASGCNPFDGTPASALQRGADILDILLSLLGAMNDASMCGGFGACFPAGTLVQMADGTTKPIQDIQPDDIVKSRDPNTGRFMSEPVLNAYREHSSHLITLTLADGASITCTPAHPIYVDGKGFVEAGQLGIGDRIVTRAGPPDRIENIASNTASSKDGQIGEYTVYNLTVAGTHTYFVGKDAGGVWVHNGCQQSGGIYKLVNDLGEALRTGRTNNLLRREAELRLAFPNLRFVPLARTDDPLEQRGLEQLAHTNTVPNGAPVLNRISPIAANNRNYQLYMNAGNNFITNNGPINW